MESEGTEGEKGDGIGDARRAIPVYMSTRYPLGCRTDLPDSLVLESGLRG